MDLPQMLNHHSHNRSRYVTVTNHPDEHPNFPNPPRHSDTLRNHHHQQQQPQQPNQQHFHLQNSRHLPPPPPPPNSAPFQPPPPAQQSPFKTPTHQGYNAAEKPQYSYANPSRERPYEEGNRSSRPSSSIVRRNFSPAQHRLGFDDRDDRRRVFLRGRSPEFDQETRSEFWEQARVLKDNPPEVSQNFRVDFDSGALQKFQPGHGKSGSPYKTTNRLRLETESGSSRFRVEYGDLYEPMKHGDERHKGYYRRSDSISSSGMSVREVEFVPRQSLPSRNSGSRPEIYDGRHEEELVRTGRRDMVYGNQRRVYDRKVLREAPSSPYKRGASEIVNGDAVHFVSAQREYPGSESERFGHGNRGDSYQNNRTPRKQYQKKSALLRIQKPYQRNTENEKSGYYDNQDSPGSSSFRRRDQYAYTGREIDEEQVERSPVHLNVSFKSNSLVAKAVATPPRASNDADTELTLSNTKDIGKECNSDKDCLNVDLAEPIGGVTDLGGSAEAINSGKETVQTGEKVISVEDLGDSNLPVTLNLTDQLLENNEAQKSAVGAEPQKDRVGSVKPPPKVMKKKKVVKKIVKKVVRPRPRVVLNFQKKKLDGPLASRACVFEPKDSITPMAVASEVNRPGAVKMVEATQLGSKSEEHVIDLTHVTAGNSGNNSSTVVESPVQEEVILDKGPECAPNSSQGLHTISERNRDLAKSYILSCAVNAEHVVNHTQSHQIGDASLGYNTDHAFSNSGHTKMYDSGIGVFYAATSADTPSITMNDAMCSNGEFVVAEEIPNDISRSSKNGVMSSPREVAINVHSSHREENIISSPSAADCFIKQVSADAAIRLSEVDATETSADTSVSVGKNKEGTPSKRNKKARQKRKVRSQLDFSRKSSSNLDATNVFKSATSMDPSCELAAFTSGNSDDGLQLGRDVPSLSSPYGISEASIVSKDNVDSAFRDSSLQCSKRRRVSTSGLTPQAEEKSVDRSLSCMESPSTSNDILVQNDMNISTFTAHTSCAATNLVSSVPGITGFHDNKLAEVSSTSNCVENLSNDEQDKGGVVKAIDMQVRREEEEEEAAVGVVVLREQDAACDETLPHPVSSSVQHPITVATSPCTDVKESDGLLEKGDFLNSSNYLSTPTDCSEATSVDEAMNCVPDSLTDTGSPQTLLNISDVDVSVTASVSKILSGTFLDDRNLEKKPANDSGSDFSAKNSFLQSSKRQSMPDCISGGQKVERNTSLTLLDSRSPSEGLNVKNAAYIRQENQHGHSTIAKEFTGPSTSQPATMKKRAFPTIAGARTWHRTSSTSSLPGTNPFTRNVPLQKQLLKRDGKFQSTSYVRKGNSLVRNPSLSSALSQGSGFRPVYQLNSIGSDVSKNSIGAEDRVIGNSHGLMPRERKEPSDEPTLLVQSGKKLPGSTAVRSGDFMPSASAGPLSSSPGDLNSETILLLENNDTAKLVEDPSTIEVLENQSQVNKSNNPAVLNEGNLTSSNTEKIVYVKRKSNQLVATSNSVDLAVVKADKSQAPSSDGYYKRKNQLIRTSLESNRREPVFMSDKSGGQMTLNAASSMKLSRRRSLKVVAKTFKRSRNSLVWTSALSQKNNSGPLTHQKVFPQLFPWKRTAYCRSFMHNWSLFSKSSSSMAISRKLLVSRQRDTVYTRSINGFSLRKSKVLSVGGSSLKWSKSIESHSKKANEEATLAVAAVERKKREQKGASYPSSGSRNKNHSSRERIFRVGLFRYKMDPSRRTLQRISDDESPGAPSSSLDKDAKKLYIPRRLVIGNNEYVRIGNGNQLIRDPKKRTRILANEKVRWSLHTARLRLAKKRKYCQFFTRFGRCNKDSGKCPYLHDSSKIAVCTKFLKGLCSNANCKLTHKVIPERMPDCSYYLQGLCTNQSCPYRHVNVNPKASTCDGFLRGYCADGDECRKKHSYVCPSFEATGTCPGRSKCKLHHPKNRVHAKKKRRLGEPRNSTGRYFGSPDPNVVSDKCFAQENKDVFLEEGTCANYIAMGVSDNDTGESIDQRTTRTLFFDSGTPSDYDDLAELIKPIRLMAAKSNSVVA